MIRAEAAPVIAGHGVGCRIRILSSPEAAGKHEVYDLDFDAGGELVSDPHSVGCREHLTVVAGEVEVESGEEAARLGPGDTGHYPADRPHAIRALGPARVFLIVQDS